MTAMAITRRVSRGDGTESITLQAASPGDWRTFVAVMPTGASAQEIEQEAMRQWRARFDELHARHEASLATFKPQATG